MKMKKTERIALLRDEYLKGKSDEERRMFDEKNIDKQYGAIMAWKRRKLESSKKVKETVEEKEEATVSSIVAVLNKVRDEIHSLKTLTDEDRGRLYDAFNAATDQVNNFDRYKKSELLQRLESERDEVFRHGESLNRKIDELRQQLS